MTERITKIGGHYIKNALIFPLLLVLGVWNKKIPYRKSWPANLLQASNLTVDPRFKVKRGHHTNMALYLPYYCSYGLKM